MNYTEVKKELKKEFESFLKPLGYKSKIDAQGCEFSILIDKRLLRIGYGISNYIDEFYTSCYSKISMLPIMRIQEKIFEETGIYDTLTNSISLYKGDMNYRYKIQTIEDIKTWGKIVQDFIIKSAFPFFIKYNSLEELNKLVNSEPHKKIVYCDDLFWHLMNSLITAKLINNPKYNELKIFFKSEIEKNLQGHFKYEKCMKVINFLDNHTQEELLNMAYET